MTAQPVEDAPCRRRWYSVYTECRCNDCRPIDARTRKLVRCGVTRPVTSDEAWDVIRGLWAQGWTHTAIASATGLTPRYIQGLAQDDRNGIRTKIGRTHAEKITQHGEPTAGFIRATGTIRRVRALYAIGYPGWRIAEVAGLSPSVISIVARGNRPTVAPGTARAVALAYDTLHMRPGTSQAALRTARAGGWAPPLAWDDIDDPGARPRGVARSGESHARPDTT